MKGLLNSDLHFVLANAVDVINDEVMVAKESEPIRQEWGSFVALVRSFSADTDKDVAVGELIARFEGLRAASIRSALFVV